MPDTGLDGRIGPLYRFIDPRASVVLEQLYMANKFFLQSNNTVEWLYIFFVAESIVQS